MKKETINFGDRVVELTIVENVIHIKPMHYFDHELVTALGRRIDEIVEQVPGIPVRVWDSSCLLPGTFKVTQRGIDQMVLWSKRIQTTIPDSAAYFIAPDPLVFGMSRMYEMRAESEYLKVYVVRSIDELPDAIKEKISRISQAPSPQST